VLFIRKEDAGKLKFDSLDDLKGYRVGVTRGYSYTKEFLDFLQTHDLQRETFSDESNFKMLANNRTDFFPADLRNGVFWVKKLGLQDQLTYLEKPILAKDYYIIFNKQNVTQPFVEKFSETLAYFKQTEKFREIEEKYLK
jgi:polar amino acid transport system substrate-binding protein